MANFRRPLFAARVSVRHIRYCRIYLRFNIERCQAPPGQIKHKDDAVKSHLIERFVNFR